TKSLPFSTPACVQPTTNAANVNSAIAIERFMRCLRKISFPKDMLPIGQTLCIKTTSDGKFADRAAREGILMKRQSCLVVLILLVTATALCGQPAKDSAAKVDELFAPWNRKDSPGCVVLVRQDGKTMHERAYGMANLELGVPLSLSSVFLLASVSKQFV